MGDERGEDADQRRADVYSSARIGAAAALTLVLVVLLVLDVAHAVYERIVVTGRTIVSIRLTPSAYAHGLALALPDKVEMARPTGVGREITTYDMPIEGRDGWLAAAQRLA